MNSKTSGRHILHSSPLPGQRGVALMVALIFLIVVTLIGLAAARIVTLETRLTGNVQNRNVAMQSAEATLRFAETGLLQGTYTNFAANGSGLYTFDLGQSTPWYASAGWSPSSTSVLQYAGPSLSSAGYAQTPQFLIEQMPSVALPGESIGMSQYGSGVPPSAVYRITARATGGDTTSYVMLQSIVH
ncbi:MAG TPA: PilX N-terminal domain-containing pilus assembly protein [Terriglobales bacterium]|nr:PilX N-terminal domain-containing pilus assembly protein [Terriglobales bacterium]